MSLLLELVGLTRLKTMMLDAALIRAENSALRGRRNCGMGDEVEARRDRTRAEMSSTGLRVRTIRG
jgi:hypothetical protein